MGEGEGEKIEKRKKRGKEEKREKGQKNVRVYTGEIKGQAGIRMGRRKGNEGEIYVDWVQLLLRGFPIPGKPIDPSAS